MNDNATQQSATGNSAQKEDYLDKGLDSAEKKFGGAQGANTEKNRGVNEKIVRCPSDRIQTSSMDLWELRANFKLVITLDRWRTRHV